MTFRQKLAAATIVLAAPVLPELAAQVERESERSEQAAGETGKAEPEQSATEDPAASLSFGVTFEGYYQYNGNRPLDRVTALRAYDTRSNSFSIQQAALVVESAPDRKAGRPFGLRLDLQFGQATETVQGSPANEPRPDVYRYVWQAYGSYVFPGSPSARVDFGKFASMLGYETNYARDNNNFSRAYLFNFLPFYHAGLRAQLPLSDRVTVLYMLTNGIQQTEDFNNFKSNHFAAVLTPAKGLSFTVNYYFGREQPDGGQSGGPDGWFRVFDTYFSYAPAGRFSVGADVNHVTNQIREGDPTTAVTGLGGYARYQMSSAGAVALRYEYVDDGGLFSGVDQVLREVTLTIEQKVADGFLIRGELRRDWSNRSFFPSRDGVKNAQTTVLGGLVWWLGGKKGAW